MALPFYIFILVSVIKSVIILVVLLTAVAYTVWLERKVVGHMQNRWGPTRVGPFGLLQPAADGLKFLFKEDLTPPHVYKPLFLAAPLIAVILPPPSIAGNSFRNWVGGGKPGYSVSDHRREHRCAADSRRYLDGRLRSRARRMGVEQ